MKYVIERLRTVRLRSFEVEIEGNRLHMLAGGEVLDRTGSGPGVKARADRPVYILVHGIGVSARYFRPLMRRLAVSSTVYAIDLPGFGVSPALRRTSKTLPDKRISLAGLAEVLLAVIDRQQSRHVVLVGHSMGCQVVVEAVRRRPLVADSVILIGPTVDTAHRRVLSQAWRLLANAWHELPSTLVIAASDYFRCGPWRYIRALGPMMRYPIERHVAACPVPVLVIRGDRDTVASRSWLQRLAGNALDGSVAEVPKAGHIVQHRRPAEVARICQDFVREVERKSRDGHQKYEDQGRQKNQDRIYPQSRRRFMAHYFPLTYGLFQTWLDWSYVWRRQAGRFLQRDKPDSYQREASGKPPIIIIPGIYEPWQFMKPLIEVLYAWKYSVHVIDTLGYNTGDIPDMAGHVRKLIEDRGLCDPVIIAHSKGGLIGKYLLVQAAGTTSGPAGRVPPIRHVIALNTPFAGSVYAALSPVRPVRSFSPADKLLRQLDASQSVNNQITSIYSRFDPSIPDGSALAGATNLPIDSIGHFRIVADAQAHSAILSALKQLADDDALAA